jgi:hypothetical protein
MRSLRVINRAFPQGVVHRLQWRQLVRSCDQLVRKLRATGKVIRPVFRFVCYFIPCSLFALRSFVLSCSSFAWQSVEVNMKSLGYVGKPENSPQNTSKGKLIHREWKLKIVWWYKRRNILSEYEYFKTTVCIVFMTTVCEVWYLKLVLSKSNF